MGFGTVGNVASIQSYEQAEKYFAERPAHTRCRAWNSNERCLKERASGNHHYRLERHDDGAYYDVCLYQQVMGRFYRPDETGQRRVLYSGHSSMTSKSFMWRVLHTWATKSMTTSDGREVVAPIYENNTFYDLGERFSLDMVLDAQGNVITNKSRHTPHYTHKSSAEDKARRVRIKQRFSNLIMLAQLRIPEFADNCMPMHDKGRPFGGNKPRYDERMAIESIWEDGEELHQHEIDLFFEMCQNVYDTLVSKRGYEQASFRLGYRYMMTGQTQSTPADLDKPVTEKDLEKAILNRVYKLVGANDKSEAVEQPQFMDKDAYPSSSISTFA
jgi:hypothetical protein